MNLLRILIVAQATYIFLTALWPLVHLESFMAVTGYKTDVWLVKTVGALLIPVAASMYTYLAVRTDHRPLAVLGSLTAVAFIAIDSYYAFSDVISNIYLADAAVELLFLVLWLSIILFRRWRR